MKIGCNYSPELMMHLEDDIEFVDAIKLSWEEHYTRQFRSVGGVKPVLLHFIPRVLSDEYLDFSMITKYKLIIEECNATHIGIHFAQSNYSDEFVSLSIDEQLNILVKRLVMIKESLGVMLLIENMPYYCLEKGYEFMADPESIQQVCEKADVGVLFDCAHAQISSWHLGISEVEYLNKLPVNRIYEVHLSSPRLRDNRYIDEHEVLQEKDYVYLKHVLEVTKPQFLTLEYGGEGDLLIGKSNSEDINTQITKIKSILHEVTSRLSSDSILNGV